MAFMQQAVPAVPLLLLGFVGGEANGLIASELSGGWYPAANLPPIPRLPRLPSNSSSLPLSLPACLPATCLPANLPPCLPATPCLPACLPANPCLPTPACLQSPRRAWC